MELCKRDHQKEVCELDAKNMEAYQGLEQAYEEAENYKEALDIQEILISFEPGKQENEIKPVSYTQLDVYKRQVKGF